MTEHQRDIETTNLAVVRRFFDAWAQQDADALAAYIADDLVYQMVEGQPDVIGKEAFIATLGPVLKTFRSVEMRILRHYAVGQLVVSERLDTLIGSDEAHSMKFAVASCSVIYDDKITVLKDYPIPNETFEIGESFL